MNLSQKENKSEVAQNLDEPCLLAQECFTHLIELSKVAQKLHFHELSTKLYAITSITERSEYVEYVGADNVNIIARIWDATLVGLVIKVAIRTVKRIYQKMKDSDLKNEQFDPDKMELETRRVMFFIETLHQKYELKDNYPSDLMEDYINPNEVLGFVPQSLQILQLLERESRFQKSPPLTKSTSILWDKIHRAESISSLLDAYSKSICPACRTEELKEDGGVAISDSCLHLVCAKCAKKLFDVRKFQESSCPTCNRTVKAWTDSEHFRKFKTDKNAKTVFWRLMRKMKNTLSSKNVPGSNIKGASTTPYTAMF